MASCPECGARVLQGARYCDACGARLGGDRLMAPMALSLPLLPGSAAAVPVAAAQDQPGLSMKQVGVAVALIGLFLLFVIFYVGRDTPVTAVASDDMPVLGHIGEAVTVGQTVWGVAFSDRPDHFGAQTPKNGQFLAVGLIAGNRSRQGVVLSSTVVGLVDAGDGHRYAPVFIAWGTPDELSKGHYVSKYTLPSHETIAGLILFDVPKALAHPRLLVRDVAGKETFAGAIDLEEAKDSEANRGNP